MTSFSYDDMPEGGFGDGEWEVYGAEFTEYDYGGVSAPATVLQLDLLDSGDTLTKYYKVGSGAKPTADGKGLDKSPHRNSNFGVLMRVLGEVGFPAVVLRCGDIGCLVGLKAVWATADIDRGGDGSYNSKVLVPVRLITLPGPTEYLPSADDAPKLI